MIDTYLFITLGYLLKTNPEMFKETYDIVEGAWCIVLFTVLSNLVGDNRITKTVSSE